ncbi:MULTISPECIES: carbohydrate ABC transporter permease [unclassified Modestobacter]|uniref:carbohydrate ABC transporter permease n=1 Tax=unclassified Modestobacter TaxID=2643866 RepID=UPI0022AB4807|nr:MULTISPECIES: carbohydrate ABC transporter permease [unclassified Modestobacter]MCZ2825651.1 carbohydrate ABC transporter permease [Modestobacter sp. VKM Ac-2981]MCZ2853284.1 carbohydrate ABC transporter permease [Modestobacter sp. VKM Ac-2982]
MTSVVPPPATAVPARAREVPARRRPRRRGTTTRRLLGVLAVLTALVWVFPVYWMINSAFLPTNRLRTPEPSFLPFGGTLSNFRRVLTDPSFYDAFRVSLAVTGLTLAAAILFAFVAALAISRFRFRGRKSFIVTVLVVQMIPAEGLFISQYQMLDTWQLVNSVVGLSIVYVAAVLPFTIWMLRGFVSGVPIELEEAAMMDGLSRTGAFFRITFPLLAPGLVASGVYGFLQAWNEYTLALVVMTDPAERTLPLWLQGLVEANRATDWGVVMAGAAVITVPVILFFLFVQRRMSSGLVAGAVKG